MKMAVVHTSAARVGPYVLGPRLGVGGMAEVYIAYRAGPHGFEKKFALKRILPQLANDSRFVAMFCDEARICAALNHPNIVQVVDFGEGDGELFMALEYVDGISVARVLRAMAARRASMPHGVVLHILNEVLQALAFAHEARDEDGRPLGIVHRDVSPGNILLGRTGEVKLTDFGIVRSDFVARRTYPGELKGKMGYMSPEQVMGHEVDARSDLFTVGIVLAELLVVRPLFSGTSDLEILTRIHQADLTIFERHAKELPAALAGLARRALSREPEKRFQSAREFASAVRAVGRRLSLSVEEHRPDLWLSELGLLGEVQPRATSELSLPAVKRSESGERLSVTSRPRQVGSGERQRVSAVPTLKDRISVELLLRMPNGASFHERLSELAKSVATGRVPLSALVGEKGAVLQRLDEYPRLSMLTTRDAYRFGESVASRAHSSVPITRWSLVTELYRFAEQGLTGVAIARSGEREKRVYFQAGRPCFVASTDPSEILGQRLVASGKLKEEALMTALTWMLSRRCHLGEALIALGHLTPAELPQVLALQLRDRFVELGSWNAGQLSFIQGKSSGEMLPCSAGDGVSLVTQLVRKTYTDQEIAHLLAPLRDRVLIPVATLALGSAELDLVGPEQRALLATESRGTLRQLVETMKHERLARGGETLRAVFIGLCSGRLRLGQAQRGV